MKRTSFFKRDTLLWNLEWDLYEFRRRIAHDCRYKSPVVRAFYRAAYNLKRHGIVSGGTDCDGMRYAGADVFWTRKAADEALEWSSDGREGPWWGSVTTGAEAREFSRDYEPDTRDRFAEAMGY